ncbi:hypothetical protein ACFQZE_09345 [Paenibacillus sp. GCM10027627]|uniref:hypothetical protein n=1 Tax=unclassified Paenibacillus TaxID=185978 RepID=UPI0036434D73
MKKGLSMLLLVIMLMTAGSSVFANGAFSSWTTYQGELSPGVYKADIAWTDLGSDVAYYEVARVPVMYPWGGAIVQGCAQLTTTVCSDSGDIGTYLKYYVKAYLKNGTVVSAPALDVNFSGYTGAPATPALTIQSLGNRTYSVGFTISQGGNNADIWELHQNGLNINNFQGSFLSENGTAYQSASKTISLSPGTYQFKVIVKNGFGSTQSITQSLVVS